MFENLRFSNSSKRSNNSLSSSFDSIIDTNDENTLKHVGIIHVTYTDLGISEIAIVIVDFALVEQNTYISVDILNETNERLILNTLTNVKMLVVLNKEVYFKLLFHIEELSFNELYKSLSMLPVYDLSKKTKMIVKKINWYTIIEPDIQDLSLFALSEDYIKIENALYNANVILKISKTLLNDNKLPEWENTLNASKNKKLKTFFGTIKRRIVAQSLHSTEGKTLSIKSL